MRQQCPHIPCIVIANKIDIDERATQRKYKFVEDLGVPFNFVSALYASIRSSYKLILKFIFTQLLKE